MVDPLTTLRACDAPDNAYGVEFDTPRMVSGPRKSHEAEDHPLVDIPLQRNVHHRPRGRSRNGGRARDPRRSRVRPSARIRIGAARKAVSDRRLVIACESDWASEAKSGLPAQM